jgi:Bacterial extracellular solute-binding protein, family 7
MTEAISALQTRVVDGTELPFTTFCYAKLYEVQTYISLSRRIWDGWWSLTNRRRPRQESGAEAPSGLTRRAPGSSRGRSR